jgi:hypothetical protein
LTERDFMVSMKIRFQDSLFFMPSVIHVEIAFLNRKGERAISKRACKLPADDRGMDPSKMTITQARRRDYQCTFG